MSKKVIVDKEGLITYHKYVKEEYMAEGSQAVNDMYAYRNELMANEQIRKDNEEVRKINEGNRVNAEIERLNAEQTRDANERLRTEHYNADVVAEKARVAKENERITAEQQRVINENARLGNEQIRVNQENRRLSNEDNRNTSENIRQSNERARQTNDSKRTSDVQTKITEVTQITNECNSKVNQSITNINSCIDDLRGFESEYNASIEAINNTNQEQNAKINNIVNKNREQDIYINALLNEGKNKRITITEKSSELKLTGNSEGFVTIDKMVGDTLVNVGINTNNKFNFRSSSAFTEYNIVANTEEYIEVEFTNSPATSIWYYILTPYLNLSMFKPLTTYTIIFSKIEGINSIEICNSSGDVSLCESRVVNGNRVVITTRSNIYDVVKNTDLFVYCLPTKDIGKKIVGKYCILEGDYTNKPIPTELFTGMQSSFENQLVVQEMVDSGEESIENLGKYKCEVKVRGKNLFGGNFYFKDFDWVNGIVSTNSSDWSISDKVYLDKGQYTISHNNPSHTGTNANYLYIILLTENGEYINIDSRLGMDSSTKTFNLDKGRYVRFYIKNPTIVDFQVEKNGTITPYEPYYESTKTVYLNNPLLKGDEIVYVDGELKHCHKMGKVVFDGSDDEAWDLYTNANLLDTVCMCIKLSNKMNGDEYGASDLICDKLAYVYSGFSINSQNISAYISDIYDVNHIYVNIYKNNLKSADKEGCVSWLQSNPITVLYELAEPYYETIDTCKLLLEIPNNATLSVDSAISPTTTVTYTTDIPDVYSLEETNIDQYDLIDVSLMATDEIYMMLEPMLATPYSVREEGEEINKNYAMINFYVKLVNRGLKDVNKVPEWLREDVIKELNK